jgi:hypothetical protein
MPCTNQASAVAWLCTWPSRCPGVQRPQPLALVGFLRGLPQVSEMKGRLAILEDAVKKVGTHTDTKEERGRERRGG